MVKHEKNFDAMRADQKGNFSRRRSRAARTKFRADHAIAQGPSGSYRARSQFFASRRNSVSLLRAQSNFSSRSKKSLLSAPNFSGNLRHHAKTRMNSSTAR